MKIRTCVTFKSGEFNILNPKPDFVHPENFGDDVVRWFMAQLRDRRVAVEEEDPSQEDHGWYVTFRVNDLLFDLVVSYAPTNDRARWLVSLERSVGLLGSIVGQRRRGATVEVVRLVNDILRASGSATMCIGCSSRMSVEEISRTAALIRLSRERSRRGFYRAEWHSKRLTSLGRHRRPL